MGEEKSAARADRKPRGAADTETLMRKHGPAVGLATAWLESLSRANAEFAHFLAERFEEDVRMQHALLNCRDPAQFREIQARYIRRAVEQYSAETGRLFELSQVFLKGIRRAGTP